MADNQKLSNTSIFIKTVLLFIVLALVVSSFSLGLNNYLELHDDTLDLEGDLTTDGDLRVKGKIFVGTDTTVYEDAKIEVVGGGSITLENANINTLSLSGSQVTTSAEEINNLDNLDAGSLIVGVEGGGTGILEKGSDGRYLKATGTSLIWSNVPGGFTDFNVSDSSTTYTVSSGGTVKFTGGSGVTVTSSNAGTTTTFNISGSGGSGGGGTCYGVSTDGGLTLSDGLCFGVAAGDGIVVGSGVSVNLADDKNLTFYGTSLGLSNVLQNVSYQGSTIGVAQGGTGLTTTDGMSTFLFSNGTDSYGNYRFFGGTDISVTYPGSSVVISYTGTEGGGGTCYGVSTDGGLTLSDGLCFGVAAGDGIVVGSGVSVNLADDKNLTFYGTSLGLSNVLQNVSYQGSTIGVAQGGTGLTTTDGMSTFLFSNGTDSYGNYRFFGGTDISVTYPGSSVVISYTGTEGGGGTCYGVSTDGGLTLSDGLCFGVAAGDGIVVGSGVSVNLADDKNLTFYGTSLGLSNVLQNVSYQGSTIGVAQGGTGLTTTDGMSTFLFSNGTDSYGNYRFFGGTDISVTYPGSSLVISYTGTAGGGGGTCYGVSTDGGLTLSDGLCFGVAAGDGIVVGSGVSVREGKGINVNSGGVDTYISTDHNMSYYTGGPDGGGQTGSSFGLKEDIIINTVTSKYWLPKDNVTLIGDDGNPFLAAYVDTLNFNNGVSVSLTSAGGTCTLLITSGEVVYNFPGSNYSLNSVLKPVDDEGDIVTLDWREESFQGVSIDGGLVLTSGSCVGVVAGEGIEVGSGVSVNLADDKNLTFYGTSLGVSNILQGLSYQGNVIQVQYGGTGLSTALSNNNILVSDGSGYKSYSHRAGTNITITFSEETREIIFDSEGTCYGVSTDGGLTLSDGLCFGVAAGDGIVVGSGVSVNLADDKNLTFYGTSLGLSNVLQNVSYQGSTIVVARGGTGLTTTDGMSTFLFSNGTDSYGNYRFFGGTDISVTYPGSSVVISYTGTAGGGGGTCYGVSTDGGLTLSDGLCFGVAAGDGIVVGSGVSVNLADDKNLTFYGTSLGLSNVLQNVSYQGSTIVVARGGTGLTTTDGMSTFLFSNGTDSYGNYRFFGGTDISVTYPGSSVVISYTGTAGGGGGTCYGVSTDGGLTLSDGLCFGVAAGDGIVVGSGVSVNLADNKNLAFYGTSLGLSNVLQNVSYQGSTIGVAQGGTGLTTTDGMSTFLFSNGTDSYGNYRFFGGTDISVTYPGSSVVISYTGSGSGGGTCYGVSTDGGLTLSDGLCFGVAAGDGIVVGSGVSVNLADNKNLAFYTTGLGLSNILQNVSYQGDAIGVSYGGTGLLTTDGTSTFLFSNGADSYGNYRFFGGTDISVTYPGSSVVISYTGSGSGGGTCYGVSTDGGLTLSDGLCFGVAAGDGIVVGSGVSVNLADDKNLTFYGTSLGLSSVLTDLSSITSSSYLPSSNPLGVDIGSQSSKFNDIYLKTDGTLRFDDNGETGVGADGSDLVLYSNAISYEFPSNSGSNGQFLTTNGDSSQVFLTWSDAPGTCYGVSTDGGLTLSDGLCFGVAAGDGIVVGSGVSVNLADDKNLTFYGTSLGLSNVLQNVSYQGSTIGVAQGGTGLTTTDGMSTFLFSNGTDSYGNYRFFGGTDISVTYPGSSVVISYTGSGGGGGDGTCYGVSTDGGLTLSDGLCFGVAAGDGIVVGSGVSVNLADNKNLAFYTTGLGLSNILQNVSYQGDAIGVSYGGTGLLTTGGTSTFLFSNGTNGYENYRFFGGTDISVTYPGSSVVISYTGSGSGGGTCYGVSTDGGLTLSDGLCFGVAAGDGIVVGSGVSVNLADDKNLTFYGTSLGLSNVLVIGENADTSGVSEKAASGGDSSFSQPFIIGDGANTSDLSTAFSVDNRGNIYIGGTSYPDAGIYFRSTDQSFQPGIGGTSSQYPSLTVSEGMSPLLEKAYRVKTGETTKTTYIYDFGKSRLYGLPSSGGIANGVYSGTTNSGTSAWIVDTGPSTSIVKYETEFIVKNQILVESTVGTSPWDNNYVSPVYLYMTGVDSGNVGYNTSIVGGSGSIAQKVEIKTGEPGYMVRSPTVSDEGGGGGIIKGNLPKRYYYLYDYTGSSGVSFVGGKFILNIYTVDA